VVVGAPMWVHPGGGDRNVVAWADCIQGGIWGWQEVVWVYWGVCHAPVCPPVDDDNKNDIVVVPHDAGDVGRVDLPSLG
jgi:hypothetical protein